MYDDLPTARPPALPSLPSLPQISITYHLMLTTYPLSFGFQLAITLILARYCFKRIMSL